MTDICDSSRSSLRQYETKVLSRWWFDLGDDYELIAGLFSAKPDDRSLLAEFKDL
jgi:hypothetical protein